MIPVTQIESIYHNGLIFRSIIYAKMWPIWFPTIYNDHRDNKTIDIDNTSFYIVTW